MPFLVQISITIFLQILICLNFLPTIFKNYSLTASLLDYFCFITFSFGVFFQIQILLFPFAFIFYNFKKILGGIFLSITGSVLIFLTLANYIVFYNEGIHLIEPHVLQLFKNPGWNREVQLTFETILTLSILLGSLFLIELLLFIYLDRDKKYYSFTSKGKKIFAGLISFLMLSGVFSHFFYFKHRGEVLEFFPFFNYLYKNKGQEPLILNYNNDFVVKNKNSQVKKHLYFLMVESLRRDRLNPDNMPLLTKFVKENGCYVSPRNFSGGHTTEYGIFTAMYGIFGQHFESFYQKSIPPFPIQLLKNNGYEMLGGSASSIKDFNRMGFIQSGYDDYREFLSKEVYKDDLKMVDWALNRLNPSKLQFLFLFFNSPHHDYYYPKEFEIYKPVVPEHFNYVALAGKPDLKKQFFNKFKNSIRFLDYNVTRFLKSASKKMDNNFIFTLLGDHGEEFWERGFHGHSGPTLIKEKVESTLIICDMKNKKLSSKATFTNHIDIFPSLFSILFPQEDFRSKFNGVNIFRPIPYNYSVTASPLFPYNKERILLVHENTKFYVEKTSKKLHDLKIYKVTDLDDNPISIDENVRMEFEALKGKYISESYRFLKPKD